MYIIYNGIVIKKGGRPNNHTERPPQTNNTAGAMQRYYSKPPANSQGGKKTMRTQQQIYNDIYEYFNDNEDVFNECIEQLDQCNGYLGDDRYYRMEELDEFYFNTEPTEILTHAFYGRDDDCYITDSHGNKEYQAFNPNREYFYYNAYGNLISSDYIDYSSHLDDYTIEELTKNIDKVESIEDNEELHALFMELLELKEVEG